MRLCYGSHRYSEDLDFVGGREFSREKLQNIASTLEHYLGHRYGLEVFVKSPREMKDAIGYEGINVDRWQVSVVTSPDRSDLPRQRIKFEVANIPSHDAVALQLQRNYDFLPSGYEDILLRVESPSEILADKLISFPVTLESHVRHRDIWDIQWLRQGNADIRPDLLISKIEDYKINDFAVSLENAIERSEDVVKDSKFQQEMTRFLPKSRMANTFEKQGFIDFLAKQTRDTFIDVRRSLDLRSDISEPIGFTL